MPTGRASRYIASALAAHVAYRSHLPDGMAHVGRENDLGALGETAARLRERGETIALSNIEIAVAAVDSSSRLWTRDSDFKRARGALPALRFFDP